MDAVKYSIRLIAGLAAAASALARHLRACAVCRSILMGDDKTIARTLLRQL